MPDILTKVQPKKKWHQETWVRWVGGIVGGCLVINALPNGQCGTSGDNDDSNFSVLAGRASISNFANGGGRFLLLPLAWLAISGDKSVLFQFGSDGVPASKSPGTSEDPDGIMGDDNTRTATVLRGEPKLIFSVYRRVRPSAGDHTERVLEPVFQLAIRFKLR